MHTIVIHIIYVRAAQREVRWEGSCTRDLKLRNSTTHEQGEGYRGELCLLEANSSGPLAEALTADHHVVFANQTFVAVAHTAANTLQ